VFAFLVFHLQFLVLFFHLHFLIAQFFYLPCQLIDLAFGYGMFIAVGGLLVFVLLVFAGEFAGHAVEVVFEFVEFLVLLGLHGLEHDEGAVRELFYEELQSSLDFVFVGAFLAVVLVEHFELFRQFSHRFELVLLESAFDVLELLLYEVLRFHGVLHAHLLFDALYFALYYFCDFREEGGGLVVVLGLAVEGFLEAVVDGFFFVAQFLLGGGQVVQQFAGDVVGLFLDQADDLFALLGADVLPSRFDLR
jgi:hypothetical protein